ncbi:GDP-L-fucose synthase family protein [Thermodesulfobacteriota bacterium]
MNKNAKIYIAGHRGLVGSAILRRLQAAGYSNLITRTHAELDLVRQDETETFFNKIQPEYVFLAAAKVGGIRANNMYPAEFIYNNLAIQTNLIHAAWKAGVKQLLFLGSSCIYPRECPQPMKEKNLLTGPLEPTNQSYAVAKIAGIIQCESYNRQYGTHFLSAMPTNLYGPNDNYDLLNSHVLPALIRKFHLAKLAFRGDWQTIEQDEKKFGKIPEDIMATLVSISRAQGCEVPGEFIRSSNEESFAGVILWGSGGPHREFLHVDDLADAGVFLMNLDEVGFSDICTGKHMNPPFPLINIGCGQDQTIKDLARLTAEIVGYSGKIFWDPSKPDGTPRKLLDISHLSKLGWKPKISLEDGIRLTYDNYLSQCAPG